VTTGIGGPRPAQPLPQARNATMSVDELAPWIEQASARYGVRPELVAAVIFQESSFINHGVHRDGTGHGLIGLDDNGLLPDFERWASTRVGRGRAASTIAPEKQIEFLAMTLADFTARLGGDEWAAVRAWHAGMNGRNRPHASQYEALIRGHADALLPQLAPLSGVEAPEAVAAAPASSFDVRPPEPVRLDPGGGTPLSASLDYGDV
jgi:soluble lytic murein transglycosylase-like protein